MATKTWTKAKPSTKAHEVIRTGSKYEQIVFVGSREKCNRYWMALTEEERTYHKVQVCPDWRNW